jgi:hypothetical protein
MPAIYVSSPVRAESVKVSLGDTQGQFFSHLGFQTYPIEPPTLLEPGWYVMGIEDDRAFIRPAREDEIPFH